MCFFDSFLLKLKANVFLTLSSMDVAIVVQKNGPTITIVDSVSGDHSEDMESTKLIKEELANEILGKKNTVFRFIGVHAVYQSYLNV